MYPFITRTCPDEIAPGIIGGLPGGSIVSPSSGNPTQEGTGLRASWMGPTLQPMLTGQIRRVNWESSLA